MEKDIHFWIQSSSCDTWRASALLYFMSIHSIEYRMQRDKPILKHIHNPRLASSWADNLWSIAILGVKTSAQQSKVVDLIYSTPANYHQLTNYLMQSPVPRDCASWWCRTAWSRTGKRSFRPAHEICRSETENAWLHSKGRIRPCPQSFVFLIFSLNGLRTGSGGIVEMNCMSFVSFCSVS